MSTILFRPQCVKAQTNITVWEYLKCKHCFERNYLYSQQIPLKFMPRSNWQWVSMSFGNFTNCSEPRWVFQQIDGLVHDCSISSALVMEILHSCTKPSKWWGLFVCMIASPGTLFTNRFSVVPLKRGQFSPKYSWKTSHSSPGILQTAWFSNVFSWQEIL